LCPARPTCGIPRAPPSSISPFLQFDKAPYHPRRDSRLCATVSPAPSHQCVFPRTGTICAAGVLTEWGIIGLAAQLQGQKILHASLAQVTWGSELFMIAPASAPPTITSSGSGSYLQLTAWPALRPRSVDARSVLARASAARPPWVATLSLDGRCLDIAPLCPLASIQGAEPRRT
jgi:hypothetical protein